MPDLLHPPKLVYSLGNLAMYCELGCLRSQALIPPHQVVLSQQLFDAQSMSSCSWTGQAVLLGVTTTVNLNLRG